MFAFVRNHGHHSVKRPEDETEEERRINDEKDPDGTRFLPPVPNNFEGLVDNWDLLTSNPEHLIVEGGVHPLRVMDNNIQSSRKHQRLAQQQQQQETVGGHEEAEKQRKLQLESYREKIGLLREKSDMVTYRDKMKQLDDYLTQMQNDGLTPDSPLLLLIESVIAVGANDPVSSGADNGPLPKAAKRKSDDGKLQLSQMFANPPAPKQPEPITHKLSDEEAQSIFASRMNRQRRR